MFKQVGIGAAAVLSIGLLAAGCGSDGDTIVTGANGNLLQNTDASPFSGFQANNLAPDGGGFSPNGVSVEEWTVTFNCDCPDSVGAFNGDGSAIVLFEVNDFSNGSNDDRVYASHYDGTGFTPPVELSGDDRDDTVDPNLDSYVVLPLNTSNYQSGNTSTATEINQVRDNSGNWLIMGEFTTQFRTPNLDFSGAHQLTSNNKGARRTVASWVWVSSLRAEAITTSNKVGGVTQPFRYGFQQLGTIIPVKFQGGSVTSANVNAGGSAGTIPSTTAAALIDIPACHVTSYGLLSDGFCGETCFDGRALPFLNDSNLATAALDVTTGGNNTTAFTHAVPMITSTAGNGDVMALQAGSLAALNDSIYTVGEDVSQVVAVWTQVASSISGGGSIINTGNATDGGTIGGHELQLRYRTFNLATLTWEGDDAEVPFAAERNGSGTTLRAGTAPFPVLRGYNGNLFFKYADASLITGTGNTGNFANQNLLQIAVQSNPGAGQDWQQMETGGHAGGNAVTAGRRAFWREIIGLVRFKDDGDGSSSLDGVSIDVSSDSNTATTRGTHNTTVPTISANLNADDVVPDREMANFNCCDEDRNNRSILGADEGMSDLSLFYVMADNTNTTAHVNMDRELLVTVLKSGTLAATSFQAGTNPLHISGTHLADYHHANVNGTQLGTGVQSILQDPIVIRNTANSWFENGIGGHNRNVANYINNVSPCWFDLQVNRTGEYAAIAFLKDTGTSAIMGGSTGFSQDLHVTIYQPFRPTLSTTSSATTTVNPANVEARVPAAGPSRVNSISNLPITQNGFSGFANPETQKENVAEQSRSWRNLPVNAYVWQGKLGYLKGFQSDRFKMSLLFEQSDSTEDHVYLSQLTVTAGTGNPLTAPTIAMSTAIEVDATPEVLSHRNLIDVTDATFNFIDTSARIWSNFEACDAGLSSAAAGGEVLVVWTKIIDNTVSDGDGAEQAIRGAVYTGSSLGTTFTIDTLANENVRPQRHEGGRQSLGSGSSAVVGATNINATNDATNGRYTEGGDADNRASKVARIHSGTRVHHLACVPNNTDIGNSPNYPNSTSKADVYIYFGNVEVVVSTVGTGTAQTVTGNGTNRTALYTRKYDGGDNGTNATIDARLKPSVATATFAQPTQIDHEQGISGDVVSVECCQNTRTVGLIFEVNEQLWYQATADGESYIAEGGLSNPLLITNQSSQDVTGSEIDCCTDSTGDTSAAMLTFTKNDVDNDNRLFIGTGQISSN
jgi:hypothetical protein